VARRSAATEEAVCFSSCLIQDKPNPLFAQGFRVREAVAVDAANSHAI